MSICASPKNVLKSSREDIADKGESRIRESERGQDKERKKNGREEARTRESVWNVAKQREEKDKQIDQTDKSER